METGKLNDREVMIITEAIDSIQELRLKYFHPGRVKGSTRKV